MFSEKVTFSFNSALEITVYVKANTVTIVLDDANMSRGIKPKLALCFTLFHWTVVLTIAIFVSVT